MEEDDEPRSDYFKTSDLASIELPENLVNPVSEEDKKYTIDDATNKIKELVEDLKNHGIKVNTDEMNFEKSYQIIIKVDKTEEEE